MVSYEKLRMIMTKYKIKQYTLRAKTGISISEAVKINKDEYMTLQSIERITKYLSGVLGRKVRVEDILTFY